MRIKQKKIRLKYMKAKIPVLLMSGTVLALNWIFLFQAYKHATVPIAAICYYFAPVLVMILCPVLFKEKLAKLQIICFVMSAAGLILTTGIGDLNRINGDMAGIAYGILAACFYALVIILNKFIHDIDAMDRTFFQLLIAAIVMFPYVMFTEGLHVDQLTVKGVISLLIVGIVHTGIAYLLYFPAVKDLTGQKTAILSYIDPLIAVGASIFVLGETITMYQLTGGLLILGFTCLNEIKGTKE
jgi:RarD protein